MPPLPTEPPAIVLVHGAWHRPSHYALLTSALTSSLVSAGVASSVEVVALPSTGADPALIAGKTVADDAAAVRAAVLRHAEQGREAVVIAHSYGGIPATESLHGLTSAEMRAQGKLGGVKGVVYITAFVLEKRGLSLKDAIGGVYGSWVDLQETYVGLEPSSFSLFYEDVTPASLGSSSFTSCELQSRASFESGTAFVASDLPADFPRVYVACVMDGAIPIQGQLAMAAAGGGKDGKGIEVVRLENSGHSPFLKPEETKVLVQVVERIAKA